MNCAGIPCRMELSVWYKSQHVTSLGVKLAEIELQQNLDVCGSRLRPISVLSVSNVVEVYSSTTDIYVGTPSQTSNFWHLAECVLFNLRLNPVVLDELEIKFDVISREFYVGYAIGAFYDQRSHPSPLL